MKELQITELENINGGSWGQVGLDAGAWAGPKVAVVGGVAGAIIGAGVAIYNM
ncbi:MAG: hypothetical protein ACRCWG_00765 [Sarcina sp.]